MYDYIVSFKKALSDNFVITSINAFLNQLILTTVIRLLVFVLSLNVWNKFGIIWYSLDNKTVITPHFHFHSLIFQKNI